MLFQCVAGRCHTGRLFPSDPSDHSRTSDPSDRRSVRGQLTELGLERVEALRRDATALQAAVFSGFSSEQLTQLRHLCLLLVRQLHRSQGGS